MPLEVDASNAQWGLESTREKNTSDKREDVPSAVHSQGAFHEQNRSGFA